jgi:hypothetical protein
LPGIKWVLNEDQLNASKTTPQWYLKLSVFGGIPSSSLTDILLFVSKLCVILPGTIAHDCNSSYAGGRDGEDQDLRTAQVRSY